MDEQDLTIRYIELPRLHFDPENPRLPSELNKTDLREVLDWMLEHENIIELMVAIGEKGYFKGEVLLVIPKKGEASNFVVVEGNRRLAAVLLLNNPELAHSRRNAVRNAVEEAVHIPSSLPVLDFENREQIMGYLGYRHITGVQPWDSLAKARYLKQLFLATEGDSLREKYHSLARAIGSNSSYVRSLLVGLEVYDFIEREDYFGIRGLSEDEISFSLLTTALRYSNIAEFINLKPSQYPNLELDTSKLTEVVKWIFELTPEGRTRIGESRNLKYLSAIVASPKALATFRRNEPIERAMLLTDVPSEILNKAIVDAKNRLLVAWQYMHEITSPEEADIAIVKDIVKISNDLLDVMNLRLSKQEQ